MVTQSVAIIKNKFNINHNQFVNWIEKNCTPQKKIVLFFPINWMIKFYFKNEAKCQLKQRKKTSIDRYKSPKTCCAVNEPTLHFVRGVHFCQHVADSNNQINSIFKQKIHFPWHHRLLESIKERIGNRTCIVNWIDVIALDIYN